MNTTEVRVTLDAMLAADPECADRDELADLLVLSRRLRGWHDRLDMQCARRARLLAAAGRSEPAESMLGRLGGSSNKEANVVTDREKVGDQMGLLEDALGDGKVSAGHLDAIATATKGLDDDAKAEFAKHQQDLMAKAETESVDTFARRCRLLARQLAAAGMRSEVDELAAQRERARVKRWVDKITGMHHTHLELDPIRDAKVWSIIDAHLAKLRQADGNAKTPWNQLQADAVIAAVEAGLNTGGKARAHANGKGGSNPNADLDSNSAGGCDGGVGRRVPEITVLVDWLTLTSGLHKNGVCETENGVPLPVSTVRRLCCDADVLPAVLGGDGEILDVGRSKRTATPQQRRALRAMYRTCGHSDCTVGFSACRIHHIRWWWKHLGRTDIDNLIPLCEKHHHLVHEGGWELTMTPGRVTTWTRPDGVIAYSGNTTNREPDGTTKPTPTSDDPELATA
jgi:hypothetical protein